MNLENKQLLLVEDEEEICAQVASYFAEDEALSLMDVVQDGSVDREQLAKADVVVLDLIIPQQDGISVLEQIAQMPPQTRPEVIVTSWFANKEIIQHTLSLGAKYFMVKPYSMDNLKRRIMEIVGVKQERRANQSIAPVPAERSLDEKITSIFLTVGIPAHIKGYQYLRCAIKMVMEERRLINRITKELYPKVAAAFDTRIQKWSAPSAMPLKWPGQEGGLKTSISCLVSRCIPKTISRPTENSLRWWQISFPWNNLHKISSRGHANTELKALGRQRHGTMAGNSGRD